MTDGNRTTERFQFDLAPELKVATSRGFHILFHRTLDVTCKRKRGCDVFSNSLIFGTTRLLNWPNPTQVSKR